MTDQQVMGSAPAPGLKPDYKGFLGFMVTNSVSANLLMLLFLGMGFYSFFSLSSEIFPEVDPRTITISVPYPGATPSEVLESVTQRVDEAVSGIDGIKKITSKASEGVGRITLELKDFINDEKVLDDVKSAVDQIAEFPPDDAEEPEVVKNESVGDVMTFVVQGNVSEAELNQGAQSLIDQLLALQTVSLVQLEGVRDYEITIEVSEYKLREYGLSIEQVASAVRRSSVNLSSGEIQTEAGDLLLRTNKKGQIGSDFENIVVRGLSDGTFVYLKDVATIRDDFANVNLINEYNGRRAAFVRVQKPQDEDLFDVAAEIKEVFEDFEIPEGLTVEIIQDETEPLLSRLSLLVRNGALGFTLVVLLLVVMLDLRLAFWVAMGVPISFFGAFLFLGNFGVSVNMVSLFGLIIVLGIVVDDAIIVGENIGAERARYANSMDAALVGVRGVIAPVTVGVVTTMCAFAPLLFVIGTLGQIMFVIPIIVLTVLAISLIEVFFILPAHLSHQRSWSRWPLSGIQESITRKLEAFRENILIPAIESAMRHRYITVLMSLLFFIIPYIVLSTGLVVFIFFPQLEPTSITADLRYPIGTPFEITQAGAEKIRSAAYVVHERTDRKAISGINYSVGGFSSPGGGPGQGGRFNIASNRARIGLDLHEEPLNTYSAREIEAMWREEVGTLPGAEQFQISSGFFGSTETLQYDLSHRDDEKLIAAVNQLSNDFKALPYLNEVDTSLNPGKRQLDVELTETGKAAGLTPVEVARQLRRNFYGEEVHRIQRGRQELKVMVRFPQQERENLTDVYNSRIRLADGTEVPLQTVAYLRESPNWASIDRIDGRRSVTVSGEVDTSLITPNQATALVTANQIAALKEEFPTLHISQTGFLDDQTKELESLANLTLIAIGVIYLLLATQLRSYSQPLVILAAVPFGAAGAILGHALLGFTLSFISIFGIVALSGVVVNDSLVLTDLFNKLRNGGMDVFSAVVEAVRRRFRAILLTTATTALGLTPMLFERSVQAQFLVPMAVSLAVGIVFASVVILFIVPALILIREDITRKRSETNTEVIDEAIELETSTA